MGGMVKQTGLWKQKGKTGQTYLSGTLSPISKVKESFKPKTEDL
jgi:hypothetical protein